MFCWLSLRALWSCPIRTGVSEAGSLAVAGECVFGGVGITKRHCQQDGDEFVEAAAGYGGSENAERGGVGGNGLAEHGIEQGPLGDVQRGHDR